MFRLAMVLLFILLSAALTRADIPARPRNIAQDLPSLLETIHPMRHKLDGRMPLVLWELPIPTGDALIWSARSGALRKAVDGLAARGIVPMVIPPGQGALALAKVVAEAGQPVYLLSRRADFLQSTVWLNCPLWVNRPAATGSRIVRDPCFATADGGPGVQQMHSLLEVFHDAGIPVAGMFFDDETWPQATPTVHAMQRDAPGFTLRYPPGALDSRETLDQYLRSLRFQMAGQVFVEPVHALYPNAVVGNFDEGPAKLSPAAPPIKNPYDLSMPCLYATTGLLPGLAAAGPITQKRADAFYLETLFAALNQAAAASQAAHTKLVPYLSQGVFNDPRPAVHFAMSQKTWREWNYHIWLRGAWGMHLFNIHDDRVRVPAAFSLQSVEDARQVYDQLLEYREFLDRGIPMTFDNPKTTAGDPIWSGLRLDDRCLIRAVAWADETRTIEIKVFDKTFSIDAPPDGATYLIDQTGRITRVSQ